MFDKARAFFAQLFTVVSVCVTGFCFGAALVPACSSGDRPESAVSQAECPEVVIQSPQTRGPMVSLRDVTDPGECAAIDAATAALDVCAVVRRLPTPADPDSVPHCVCVRTTE